MKRDLRRDTALPERRVLLCCLRQEPRLSSGDIAKQLGLTHSNTSKVIRSVEKKGLIERILGDDDKRQMYFSLTQEGERCLKELECCDVEIPDVLKKIL